MDATVSIAMDRPVSECDLEFTGLRPQRHRIAMLELLIGLALF
ncbi:MAG: hypothetical protein RL459_525, partial [Pseudomonadota bacterium]